MAVGPDFCLTTPALLVPQKLPERIIKTMKYRRIFPVESLRKVENPWKGITLNRCILVAMVVVVVSSTVEIVQDTIEPYFEATEEEPGSELQAGEAESDSWWDTFAFWNWGSEDKLEEFKKKRAARPKQDGEKVGPRKIRNKEMAKGFLKERE
ncbi:hypothetical protein G5714_021729 [Onychostoma macrolepis]|uniref:Uncharacterized protein n=1 Tax=Onychostoma macrolepis TaxID=369639 RepID=A0A7J6BSK5_9TELE|nr:hypothetical protein G5714_021729 [Onychostoma macrolepis]